MGSGQQQGIDTSQGGRLGAKWGSGQRGMKCWLTLAVPTRVGLDLAHGLQFAGIHKCPVNSAWLAEVAKGLDLESDGQDLNPGFILY